MATTNGNSTHGGGGSSGSPDGGSSGGGSSGSGYPDGGQTFVDTDGLHFGAGNFEHLGNSFLGYASGYSAPLTYEPLNGGPGDDEMWKNFAPSYQQSTDQFLAGVRELGTGLIAIARGVHAMADAYERTENTNTELARTLLRQSPASPGSGDPRNGEPTYGIRERGPVLAGSKPESAPRERLFQRQARPGEPGFMPREPGFMPRGQTLQGRMRQRGEESVHPAPRLERRVAVQAPFVPVWRGARPGSRRERGVRVQAPLAPALRPKLARLLLRAAPQDAQREPMRLDRILPTSTPPPMRRAAPSSG